MKYHEYSDFYGLEDMYSEGPEETVSHDEMAPSLEALFPFPQFHEFLLPLPFRLVLVASSLPALGILPPPSCRDWG